MSVWVPGSRVWAPCWGGWGNCRGRLPAARALPGWDPRKAEGAASWMVRVIPKRACLTLLPSFGAGGGPVVPDFHLLFSFPTQGHRGSTRFGQKQKEGWGEPSQSLSWGFPWEKQGRQGKQLRIGSFGCW